MAVSAYTGAAIFGGAGSETTAELRYVTVAECAELQGIAVRSERRLAPVRGLSLTAGDGERLPAGGELGRYADGRRLTVDAPAVFFSGCDGYEALCPELLSGLSVPSLQGLMNGGPKGGDGGRLVADYVWYFAALADADSALPEDGGCRVLFDGFESAVPARLLSVSAAADGKRAVLLRLTCGGEAYLSLRRTGARLISAEYSGLEIPNAAIRDGGDGGKFVRVISAGRRTDAELDIIYQGEGFSIAAADSGPDGLREGGTVLLDN